MCDLLFNNHGSFVTCWPETDKGREWLAFNIIDYAGVEEEIDDCLWPIHIEHRYLTDIVLGARADGLVCEG